MKRTNYIHLVIISAIFSPLLAISAAGQNVDYEAARLERRIKAVKINEKITIDGTLDESIWERAPVATDFIQNEPREGAPSSLRTEARVLYDQDNLYIGARLWDPNPDTAVVSELKEDFSPRDNDVFGFMVDTFHDRSNGYQFQINPRGARFDTQFTNEGVTNNRDWDGVWYVKTRYVDDGWIAEVALPFKTLKFPNTPVQDWGINFLRRIRRTNEEAYWSPLPRLFLIFKASLAGTLEGLEGIQPTSNLRIKPYISSSLSQINQPAGIRNDWSGDGGLDVKYGLGSALTLDLTANTDFSQVEADEQQVNLTRFSLFFPEKREFFVENSGLFTVGSVSEVATGGSLIRQPSSGNDLLFFSRRIGLSNDGREVPILAGARLSGRMGLWSLGFLNMQTRKADPTPVANFTVGRIRRDIFAGSQIGAIFVNKQERQTGHYNRTYGADANLRFGPSQYVNLYYAKTDTPGIQSQNDAYRASYAFVNRTWDIRSAYSDIANNFNPEVGFYARTGIRKWLSYTAFRSRPSWRPRWVRETALTITPEFYWTQSKVLESKSIESGMTVVLSDGAIFEAGRNASFERLLASFTLQRRVTLPVGDYWFDDYFVAYTASRASKAGPTLRLQKGDFYSGKKSAYTLGALLRPNYHVTLSVNYTRNDIRLPQGNFKTDLVSTRVDYSFTTTMFLNALIQYNTDAGQWTSNVRFNIIHRPLSDFFLVYNERRQTNSRNLIDRAIIAKLTYTIGY